MLINGTTELAYAQLTLKFLVTGLWELIAYHPQHPLYSLITLMNMLVALLQCSDNEHSMKAVGGEYLKLCAMKVSPCIR